MVISVEGKNQREEKFGSYNTVPSVVQDVPPDPRRLGSLFTVQTSLLRTGYRV
jgi:hypothetical protein